MLPDNHPLKPVYEALAACVRALDAFGAPYMFIGAVAVSLHSEARATDDVDASVWLDDEQKLGPLMDCLAAEGIRIERRVPLDLILRANLLRLVHEASGAEVDVALASTSFESQALKHVTRKQFGGLSLPLPRAEDVAVMKAFANRLQDHADLEKLLFMNPAMDLRHIRKWLRQMAVATDSPDLLESFDRNIAAARKRNGMLRRRLAAFRKQTGSRRKGKGRE